MARLDHAAIFRLLPDAADGGACVLIARLWLDADVLLLKPIEIDPAKPYFAWERPHQLGNSVLYLPPDDPIVLAFEDLIEQDELTPDWLSLRHRLTFTLRKLRGGSNRLSDIRVAIFGPAALTALARRADELQHALPKNRLRGACRTQTVFRAIGFFEVVADPESPGFTSRQRPRQRAADGRQLVCVGDGEVRQVSSLLPCGRRCPRDSEGG